MIDDHWNMMIMMIMMMEIAMAICWLLDAVFQSGTFENVEKHVMKQNEKAIEFTAPRL